MCICIIRMGAGVSGNVIIDLSRPNNWNIENYQYQLRYSVSSQKQSSTLGANLYIFDTASNIINGNTITLTFQANNQPTSVGTISDGLTSVNFVPSDFPSGNNDTGIAFTIINRTNIDVNMIAHYSTGLVQMTVHPGQINIITAT